MYTLDAFQARFGANPSFVGRLAKVFLTEGPRQREALRVALVSQSPREIERAAHTLKGAVSNYQYPALVDLLSSLEERASSDADDLRTDFALIAAMVTEMVDQLSTLATPD